MTEVVLIAVFLFNQVSSETVVKKFIERIEEVNDLINAVVDDRFDLALQEARDVDAFLATTTSTADMLKSQKPFLGVPFTTKDSTACKGKLLRSPQPLPYNLNCRHAQVPEALSWSSIHHQGQHCL